jgi:hypothetical protein
MKLNDCKGCRTYELYPCRILSTTIEKGIKLLCPCIECLIKPICLIGCDDYDKYEGSIWTITK